MEAAFTCSTPTVPANDALRERLERLDVKAQLLRELETYVAGVRGNEHLPTVDHLLDLIGFPVELPEIEWEYEEEVEA